jgi:hypothetical protein
MEGETEDEISIQVLVGKPERNTPLEKPRLS